VFADGAMWHINEAHDNFNAGTKGRVYLQGEALEGQTLTLVNTLSDADGTISKHNAFNDSIFCCIF
jgi:hypothetical protein